MKTIHIDLSDERGYDIIIGGNIAGRIADVSSAGKRIFVFDTETKRLFGDIFPGSESEKFAFGRGESDKKIDNVVAICRAAIKCGLDRKGCFIAVGGGVTGDMTGFASGIYLRGAKCIQVPTSLLAMVDSSVGGKTAVDLPEGKNLIGVFHQPEMVLIDTSFLKTLPVRELHSGLAEVVKMAAGFDAGFFEMLERSGSRLSDYSGFEEIAEIAIGRSCELKAQVVAADERETCAGGRELLNFGHTFGHAIESAADFVLSHGECVSIGMVLAGLAACKRGIWSEGWQLRLKDLLEKTGLPVTPPAGLPFEKILSLMRHDKKNRDGHIALILPEKLGKLVTFRDFTDDELRDVWCAGGGEI